MQNKLCKINFILIKMKQKWLFHAFDTNDKQSMLNSEEVHYLACFVNKSILVKIKITSVEEFVCLSV